MKTLESIIHLYINCKAEIKSPGSNIKYVETLNGAMVDIYRCTSDVYEYITPILRPLDSMTEEEAKDLYDQVYPDVPRRDDFKVRIIIDQVTGAGVYYEGKVSIIDYVNWYPWLLSRSFDLFGLIDSGLALNATKLEGYASKI